MCISNGCILVSRVFQFNYADRNAIDEKHYVGSAVFLTLVHLELVNRSENIVRFASVIVLLIVDVVDVDRWFRLIGKTDVKPIVI